MILPHDEAGDGPAVVLVHAGIADRRMWTEHLPPLADAGHRVIAVDLPGFGEAGAAAGEYTPWIDVLETMDALDVGRAALIGVSFGGGVALRLTVLAPARVRALVLVSAPADEAEPSPRLADAWAAEEAALERGDVEGAVAAVIDAWTLPDGPPSVRARVADMQRRAFELALSAAPEPEPDEAADPLQPFPDTVADLHVPALVLYGEHDMPDFSQSAQRLAGALPEAVGPEVLAGAGHLAPLEVPDEFRRRVLEFLAGPGGASP